MYPYAIMHDAFIYFLLLVDAGLILILIGTSTSADGARGWRAAENVNLKALVMIPCKGAEIAFGKNIEAALQQDYRNYDVVAIVDSMKDKSIKVLRRYGIEIIKARGRCGGCSGKVRALSTAIAVKRNYDAYVVLDSDVRVGKRWLSELLMPLTDEKIGISTTFPYFRPVGGFWSRMKMVWGFVGQGLMESKATRFGWGGSLAFRKGLIDGKDEMRYFTSMVSDDIAITRIAKAKNLGIAYCSRAHATVDCDESFASLWEWSNRQAALSIAGNRKVLYYGVAFYAANILLFLSGIALSVLYTPLYFVLLMPFAIGIAKTRRRAGGMHAQTFIAFAISPFMYLANLLVASRMRSITWRGNIYDISGEGLRTYERVK